jgi:predicted nucleotidyltransferase
LGINNFYPRNCIDKTLQNGGLKVVILLKVYICNIKMRLTKKEISTIKNNVLNFDEDAKIFLFGSRVNTQAKGGDIDILVISNKIGFAEKIKIKTGIFKEIEEQKLDLVIKKDFNDTFVRLIEADLQCL